MSLNIPRVTDTDAWHDRAVRVGSQELRAPGPSGWLAGRPAATATGHDELLFLVRTNHGLSRCGELADFADEALLANVPMGYTSLELLEKRAVVASGQVARLWPGRRGDVRRDDRRRRRQAALGRDEHAALARAGPRRAVVRAARRPTAPGDVDAQLAELALSPRAARGP